MRRTMSVYVIAIGVGALLAGVLACGPASSGGGGAPTEAPATEAQNNPASGSSMPAIEPCSIVTQDEATAFFGVASGAGDPSVGSLTATCIYTSTDNKAQLAVILAWVQQGGALGSDQYKYMIQGGQDVPGLGDGASWVPAEQLDVAKGSWIMTLNGAMGGKNVGADKLTPLAQTAVGRLP